MVEKAIELTNENDEILSKEDFLKQMEELYDTSIANTEDYSLVDDLIEHPICTEELIETSNFVDRTIYISSEITPEMANGIYELIRFWNLADEIEGILVDERIIIKVIINTPGGELNSAFTIIDAIELSKTPVYTYTIGTGYSGGFFIGVCGHKRFGYPHSSYCFHEGSAQDCGDAHKFIQKVDFYKKQLEIIKNITIEHTSITEKEYEKRFKDDWFMTAQEALENGVIDEIVKDIIM